MATTSASLLSWVARDSAESAHRRLGEAAHPTAAEVQGLLELHRVLTDLLRRDWAAARAALAEGIEAGRLRAMLGPIRDSAEAQLDFLSRLRNLAGAAEAPLASLAAEEAELRALREEATRILDWLAAPRPPIDQERLARGMAQAERGEVVSADEILARLRAGEEP